MIPARFILNSDYTTVRNTGETKISITIPNSITVPMGVHEYTIGEVTAKIGSATDTFLVYYSSTAFPYVSYGNSGGTKPDGASTTYPSTSDTDYISFSLKISGDTATFKVWCYGYEYGQSVWTGYGQTITAHVLTFKDPFSE